MRISDWSSDVCSSDLARIPWRFPRAAARNSDPLPRTRPVPSVPLERINDRPGQASRLCGRGRLRAGVPSRLVSSVGRKLMKQVLVDRSKGGVGKTSTDTTLASKTAHTGQHNGLVDAEQQGPPQPRK